MKKLEIEEVVVYKALDGYNYATLEQAQDANLRFKLSSRIKEINTDDLTNGDIEFISSFIVENKKEIIKMLTAT